MKPARKKVSSTVKAVAGWRLWLFRLLVTVGVPAVFFVILELGLWLAGFGYPTNFLLPSSNDGQKTFVENNQFGWRFFGRQMAREPYPFSISRARPANTIRIFVFGESAAYGDPQPRFGLSRMIQAMLGLRYPGTRFEVVNTGMTGINSHTILPIARDCAAANGDIWVLYMGNNEVVGPFGAGTVFGPQAPPLPLVRASLALKATRTGQLFDSLVQGLRKPPPEKSEWGGMLMFLDHQISADDLSKSCRPGPQATTIRCRPCRRGLRSARLRPCFRFCLCLAPARSSVVERFWPVARICRDWRGPTNRHPSYR